MAASATTATYVTDVAAFAGLGDTPGPSFDFTAPNGVTGTTGSRWPYLVNSVALVAGMTSTPDRKADGAVASMAVADGASYPYRVPSSVGIIISWNRIGVGGDTDASPRRRGKTDPLSPTGGNGVAPADLTATVSVPEPATWVMMVTGLGLIGFGARRRRPPVVPG